MNIMNKGKMVDFLLALVCTLLFGLAATLVTVIFDVFTMNIGIIISFVAILVGAVVFGLLRLGNSALTASYRDEVEGM